MKDGEVTGSVRALWELFSRPAYLPHGSTFVMTRKLRREARLKRVNNWQRLWWRGMTRLEVGETVAKRDARKVIARRPLKLPPPPIETTHACAVFNRICPGKQKQHVRGRRACQTCRKHLGLPVAS